MKNENSAQKASFFEQEKMFFQAAEYWAIARDSSNSEKNRRYYDKRIEFCIHWGGRN